MDALAETLADAAVIPDATLEREFETRLAECSSLAFRVALGVLRNREDAEDVAQEAFVRAYRSFAKLRERDRFRAWLVRIAWRIAIDRIRAAKRRERWAREAPDPPAAPNVEDLAAAQEFERRVSAAVDELPEKLRIVMLLGAIAGHDTREMAALLDLPEGTVKSRLFHARRILAERLL
jgi:RNA polymerase sigma-70 factor (ECF subfamily)